MRLSDPTPLLDTARGTLAAFGLAGDLLGVCVRLRDPQRTAPGELAIDADLLAVDLATGRILRELPASAVDDQRMRDHLGAVAAALRFALESLPVEGQAHVVALQARGAVVAVQTWPGRARAVVELVLDGERVLLAQIGVDRSGLH